MLRALWFAVKVGVLVGAAVWVVNRPGMVEMNWLGYNIHAHLGFVLLALLIALCLILLLYKLFLSVVNFRKFLSQRAARKREKRGYRAFTLGLSAVAAGDGTAAAYQAARMRKLLPDGNMGLSYVLDAQAARLKGDKNAAQAAFDKLLANEDTAFLGLRGMIAMAAEQGDTAAALSYARQVSNVHAKQPWVIKTLYGLELREGQWENALITLKRAQKHKIVDKDKAASDRVAIALQQAEEALRDDKRMVAQRYLQKAHKLDKKHVPAAIRLASFYADTGKRRQAVTVIKDTWRLNPHPELAELWARTAPKVRKKSGSSQLDWFEKLVALKPDSVEGQLAIARIAIDEHLWGEARQYLVQAEKSQPSARLYRLWAQLEEGQDHIDSAQTMLKKATDAEAEKVWACTETGRVYKHWSPIAGPHGSFNTIVWGYPRSRQTTTFMQELTGGSDLLIDNGRFAVKPLQ